jgi:DNA-binding NtrC family response regulator
LRDRAEDIPALAGVLLQQLSRELRRPAPRLDAGAEQALSSYHWPGNVRELRNVLERALLLAPRPELLSDADLRLGDHAGAAATCASTTTATSPSIATFEPDDASLQAVQWRHIQQVLAEEGGSVNKAARRLNLPRSSLYEMLRRGEGPRRREKKRRESVGEAGG